MSENDRRKKCHLWPKCTFSVLLGIVTPVPHFDGFLSYCLCPTLLLFLDLDEIYIYHALISPALG